MALGAFGQLFKALRIKRGQTLRAFCQQRDLDPGNISKLERGRLPPPDSDDRLRSYAEWLGLIEGGAAWQEFFDLARAERGEIPRDILEDHELVEKLPVVFRMIRGSKADGDGLDRLIDKIRRA